MKRKRFYIVICIIFVLLFLYYTFQWSSNTANGAIRRYVFLKGNPIESFLLEIRDKNHIDNQYGKAYIVHGYYGKVTGDEISYFYLKQDSSNKWYVTSCGTGP